MSHYVVVVIGDDPEGQLAPFNEQGDTDDPYMEEVRESVDLESAHLAWTRNRDRALEEGKKYATAMNVPYSSDTELLKHWNDVENYEVNGETFRNGSFHQQLHFEKVSDSYVAEWYHGSSELVEEDGEYYYSYWTNPNGKWDWFQVGGRWSGFFRVKPNASTSNYALGERSWANEKDEIDPLCADQAMKRDVDWDEMRRLAETAAGETYDKYLQIVDATPPSNTWAEVLATVTQDFDNPGREEQMKKAREFYHNQPRVQALNQNNLIGWGGGEEQFQMDRDEFVRLAGIGTYTPYAVLHNGTWYQRGEMGWFGMGHGEMSDTEWADTVDKIFQSLDDETLITAVDCHT